MRPELGKVRQYQPDMLMHVMRKEDPLQGKKELRHYTNEGMRIALSYIDRHYGGNRFTSYAGPERDNRLFYHERMHTEGVILRTTNILLAINKAEPDKITYRDIQLGILAASFHDAVQNWILDEKQKPARVRLRTAGTQKRGQNELESAIMAAEYMEEANRVNKLGGGHDVYSQQDMDTVREAILLTDTSDAWNGETLAVKGFGKAGILAQALQLADLGTGMEEPFETRNKYLGLFAEENLDFRDAADKALYFSRFSGRQALPDEGESLWYKSRLLKWFESQKTFIEGRRKAVRQEINQLHASDEAKVAVNALFADSHFDASLVAVDELLTEFMPDVPFKDWSGKLMDALIHNHHPYFRPEFNGHSSS